MRRPEPSGRAVALGLDLGSTNFKAGLLAPNGELAHVESEPAPPLRGDDAIREGDASEYCRAASDLLERVAAGLPAGTPLGIATQRSSFVLWDPSDGTPVTPLVSWQDRRAAAWSRRNAGIEEEVARRTGLLLSAHYVGPKLATLREADARLARHLSEGTVRFGTLETFLLWQLSGGRLHETDVTVAARTLMLDITDRRWSPELLRHFGVSPAVLPRVCPTVRESGPVGPGLELRASLGDQAAAALAAFSENEQTALISLGTGVFVLTPTDDTLHRLPGYLTAPILADAEGNVRYALEGTINGVGPALDGLERSAGELPAEDPTPSGFCVPDAVGLGSPYWRADIGLRWSKAAERLAASDRRRVLIEGTLFRIHEILTDLTGGRPPRRVLLAGGLTRERSVASGLATLLGRPVEILATREGGLLAAARLAAGMSPYDEPGTITVKPTPAGSYLGAKLPRWRNWLGELLGTATRRD